MNLKLSKVMSFAQTPHFVQYGFVILAYGMFFILSINIQGESEVLFSIFYVIIALSFALITKRGPTILAGVLTSVCVDYHYLNPIGQLLDGWSSILLFALIIMSVVFATNLVSKFKLAFLNAEKLRKKAEKAVIDREQILSVVAHDLRQPLTVIKMDTQIFSKAAAKDGKINADKVNQFSSKIIYNTLRIDRMIEDLLDIACIDTNQLSIKCLPFDLAEEIKEVVCNLSATNVDRSILVSALSILDVCADRNRIKQVLENLISNAIKYGRAGTVVQVDAIHEDDLVTIKIQNQGVGIKANEIPLLFNRFTRVPGALTSATKGLGVGLYITRGIVEAHGGKIGVESVENESTTFFFTLPSLVPNQYTLRSAPQIMDSGFLHI